MLHDFEHVVGIEILDGLWNASVTVLKVGFLFPLSHTLSFPVSHSLSLSPLSFSLPLSHLSLSHPLTLSLSHHSPSLSLSLTSLSLTLSPLSLTTLSLSLSTLSPSLSLLQHRGSTRSFVRFFESRTWKISTFDSDEVTFSLSIGVTETSSLQTPPVSGPLLW